MSDTKLPPQTSPTDTSNWDNKVFNTPVVKSVGKLIKNKERREIILNAPESKRPRTPKNPDIERMRK
ncbi:hypothetical protein KA529_02460 [Candidatus Saccharibacteria bacterium]|nr:hypothetical protein [Candidatus Saccharibacteria bacterium]